MTREIPPVPGYYYSGATNHPTRRHTFDLAPNGLTGTARITHKESPTRIDIFFLDKDGGQLGFSILDLPVIWIGRKMKVEWTIENGEALVDLVKTDFLQAGNWGNL